MPTLADLRAKFGPATDAFTDQELYELAAKAYGPLYANEKVFQKEFGYDPNSSNIARGFKIGGRGALGAFAGAGAAVADAVGATDARDSMLGYAQEQQRAAFRLGRRSDDVDNFTEDPLAFLAGGLGQAAAYAVPSIVGGGLPALGLRAAGASAARQLSGAAAGSYFGSNLPQEVGSIYADLAEQGKYEPGRALLYGAGAAALDTATEAVPFLRPAKAGGLLRRVATGALAQAPVEAGTEAVQTAIERAGAYKPLDDADAWHEYRNTAALGVISGGAFGAVGGLRGLPKQPVADDKPTDLTTPQAPAAEPPRGLPLLGWNGQLGTAVNAVANPTPFAVGPEGRAATAADEESMRATGLARDTYDRAANMELLFGMPGRGITPDSIDARLMRRPPTPEEHAARQKDLEAAMSEPTGYRVASEEQNWLEHPVDMQEYRERDAGPDLTRLAIIEAEKKAAQRRTAAEDAFVERDPDGKLPIKINHREIETHAALQELVQAGAITQDQYADFVGRVREALKNADNKALNAIAKQAKTLAQPAPTAPAAAQPTTQGAPGAQPNVPGTAPVVGGAAGSTGNQPAGSGRAVGSVRRVPKSTAGAPAPVAGSSAAPAPVAVGNTGGSADSVTPYSISDAKQADGQSAPETVRVNSSPDKTVAVRGDGRQVDITNMVRAGFTVEHALARAIGTDTSGKNVEQVTAVKTAEDGSTITVLPPVKETTRAPAAQEDPDTAAFRRSFVSALRDADPADQELIHRWLGTEENAQGELEVVGEGESYAAIGQNLANAETGGVGMSKQAVAKRINAVLQRLGAPEGASPKLLYKRLGIQLAGVDADSANRSLQSTTTDDQTSDELAELGAEQPGNANEEVSMAPDEARRERDTASDDEIDDTDLADVVDNPNVEQLPQIEDDIREGVVTRDDAIEAQLLYIYTRSAGQPTWNQLAPAMRATFVRTYASYRLAGHKDVLEAKQIRKDHEERAAKVARATEERGAAGNQPSSAAAPATAAETGSQGDGQGSDATQRTPAPKPAVTVKKRRIVAKAPNDQARIPDDSETTAVSRADVLDTPEGKRATGWLQGLGLGHVFGWVSDWRLINNLDPAQSSDVVAGFLSGTPDSGYTLALKPLDSEASMAGVVTHELGHAVDLAPAGGVYSAHPLMAFDGFAPQGAVARELSELNDGDTEFGGMFDYPFDHTYHNVSEQEMAGELFAELFSVYVHPKGRELLKLRAPTSYQFMKDVVDDLRKARPLDKRSQAERQARVQAFQRRVPPASPVRDGDSSSRTTARSTGKGAAGKLDALSAKESERQGRLEDAVRATLGPKARGAWTNIKDFFAKTAPYVLTNFQIYEQFKDRIKGLDKYNKIADLMRVEAQVQQSAYDAVAERWKSLGTPVIRALNKVAQRATLSEIHPDKPWDSEDNAHVDRSREDEYKQLAADYKALPDDAKAVYQDALRVMNESHERMETALESMFDSYGKTMPRINKVAGPYFPLMRFGEYLAIGESKEYKDAEAAAEGLEGEARTEALEKLREMQRDRKHYIVSAHETRAKMEAALRQYESEGLDVRPSMADQRLQSMPTRNIHATITSLTEAASRGMDSAASDKIRKAIAEIVMRSLPEMHALQRQAERVGVEGAEPDMLRAFAAQGRSNAFYTARLMYAKEQSDVLAQIKRDVYGKTLDKNGEPIMKPDPDNMHVYRELEQRAALNLTFHDTPIQDKLATAGYIWFLGSSPTYLVMQGLQTYLVAGPVLAGKYGAAKATSALTRASGDAIAVLKAARFKDGKLDLWSGISEKSIPGESVNEDRKALRELMARGIVDEGMTFNLGMIAEGGSSGVLSKGVRGIGWAAQQIEMFNRVATALAAFRLARQKGTYAEAVEAAYSATVSSHMDYSQEGTARFMREGGGVPLAKLLFQFRRYQQAMFYLLAANAKKLTNPAERKAALATLTYLSVTTGLAAGIMGMPFMGTALFIANMLRDKDDEEGDAQTVLRNALYDMTGDKDVATVLAKGLPAMFGVDLSARIGLSSVAQLYPRLEMGKTGAETIGNVGAAVAGPVLGGLGTQLVDAFLFARNGDAYKATEKLLPKVASDALKGMRYWSDGLTDRKGEEILGPEEFGAWNAIVRMAGASSIDEANYYEGTRALQNVKEAMRDRKAKIGQRYRAALQDDEDMGKVRDLIDAYNEDHPSAPILPKDEVMWRRLSLRSRRERDEETGLKLGKRDAAYENVMRFAR